MRISVAAYADNTLIYGSYDESDIISVRSALQDLSLKWSVGQLNEGLKRLILDIFVSPKSGASSEGGGGVGCRCDVGQ